MSTTHLNLADIQGNVVRAYGRFGFPCARYYFLRVDPQQSADGRAFVARVRRRITTAVRWREGPNETAPGAVEPPDSTLNIAFTSRAERTPAEQARKDAFDDLLANFTFGDDKDGIKCPYGAHLRRVNTRDMLLRLPVRWLAILGGGIADLLALVELLALALPGNKTGRQQRLLGVLATIAGQRALFGVLRVFWANLVLRRKLVAAYDNTGTAIVTRDVDDHARAGLRECTRDGGTDTGVCAGDQGALATQGIGMNSGHGRAPAW